MNDNELVFLANDNNEDAINLIIDKYSKLINTILNEFTKIYNIVGIDRLDLFQEGLIGLINAIRTFRKEKDVLFYTYASKCIKYSILSEIRKSFRNKNKILNSSYSLDLLYDDSSESLYDIIKDIESDPSNIIINNESYDELFNNINSLLSKNEKEIFNLKIKGLSNREIALLLEKDSKYVENSLFRINRKYKKNLTKVSE